MPQIYLPHKKNKCVAKLSQEQLNLLKLACHGGWQIEADDMGQAAALVKLGYVVIDEDMWLRGTEDGVRHLESDIILCTPDSLS